MINLQNVWVINLLKKQAMKLKREERTRKEQIKIIRCLIPFYQGMDLLLEDE